MASLLASRLLRRCSRMSGAEWIEAYAGASDMQQSPSGSPKTASSAHSKVLPSDKKAQTIPPEGRFGLRLKLLPKSVTSQETLDHLLGQLGIVGVSTFFAYTGIARRLAEIVFISSDQRDEAYRKTCLQFHSECFDVVPTVPQDVL